MASNVPVCVHFQRGYCSFGNSCRYIHIRYYPLELPLIPTMWFALCCRFPSHSADHQFRSQSRFHCTGYRTDLYQNQYRHEHHHQHEYQHHKNQSVDYRRHQRPFHNEYTRRFSPYHYHQTRRYQGREPPFRPREFEKNPDRSSPYSSMYPTKREERIHSYIDPSKQTLIFDIDGTIADIEKRLALAPGTKADGTRNAEEWNIVLNGNNYKHDRVIPVAWAYLKYIESLNKYNILYLSGRRSKTLKDSMNWLFTEHQYPRGFVIHRLKGVSGYDFKQQQLYKLSRSLNVAGYFGDRIIDDAITSIKGTQSD